MMKPNWQQVTGAIGLGFALLLIASWFSPMTREICGYAYETYEKNCPAYSVPLFLGIQIGEFLDLHNGAVIAVFTGVLTVATILLWTAGERHSERELRAYIAIQGGAVAHATVDNVAGFRVQVQLKNSGATPGYKFTTWIMPPVILPLDSIPFGPPRSINERTGSSIIGPGADAWITWYSSFSSDDVEQIRQRKKAIFIWGGADYTDAFSRPRHFIFRDMISGTEDSPGTWALKPHKLGYDAN